MRKQYPEMSDWQRENSVFVCRSQTRQVGYMVVWWCDAEDKTSVSLMSVN